MKTYTIKPLVWIEKIDDGVLRLTARTPLVKIVIYGRSHEFWYQTGHFCSVSYKTKRAAKLAAERWYIEQIEQALTQG